MSRGFGSDSKVGSHVQEEKRSRVALLKGHTNACIFTHIYIYVWGLFREPQLRTDEESFDHGSVDGGRQRHNNQR